MPALLIILGIVIGFLAALLKNSRQASEDDATIQTVEAKVNSEQVTVNDAQKDADEKLRNYLDSLSKLDPTNKGGTNH
jgi:hypothetical protein